MTSVDIDQQVADLVSVDSIIARMMELAATPWRLMPELDLDPLDDDSDDLYDPPQDSS